MAYSTQTDIEEQVSQAELIELTDDTGAGSVDTSAVARAIADADAEIDGYCGARYTVPFSPAPAMIRKLSVDIAVYNLFSRRSNLKMPEDRQKRYDNAVRFLRDVSRGLISLGADAPAEPDSGLPRASTDRADRIFTTGRPSAGTSGSLDNY
ncbi:MAG: DUF1320 domain-containing protein [Deltaproteobacteria bacterium HGW-Deltaproteobacteria-19]|jgi:phage gp36-like protein|nr:MAG: DUF1320 domain-containing protein [Deltaproteobacteria bacterium HGW-Deltaproteobacteria-19]